MEIAVVERVRGWIAGLFVRAIRSCSREQDRISVVAWLASVREVLHRGGSRAEQVRAVYAMTDMRSSVGVVLRGVEEGVRNYARSSLPLSLKVALPATLAAAGIVGGQGAGVVMLGGAIGIPALLIVFLGVAGLTSVIDVFVRADGDPYLRVVLALIARDEALRRTSADLQAAMRVEMSAPKRQTLTGDGAVLAEQLLALSPADFERHVMSFFQARGLTAWVTQASNDAGVDGFARHPDGLVVVQCKRNAADNPVGRPLVQQFKGVIEENRAWRGYLVTTATFTAQARDSARKNDALVLIDIDGLVAWHREGFNL